MSEQRADGLTREELAVFWRDMAADAREQAERGRKYAEWLESEESAEVPDAHKFGTPEENLDTAASDDEWAVKCEATAALLASAAPATPAPDTQRLDWLEKQHYTVEWGGSFPDEWELQTSQYGRHISHGRTLREAIDAAMNGAAP